MITQTFFASLGRPFAGRGETTRWIPALLVWFAVCVGGFSNTQSLGQVIQWYPDISSAAQAANAQNKLILLHFTATWCTPCRNLDTFVFTSPDVQRAFQQNVVAVKIDVDENSHLVQEYGVASVPYDVALTTDGRVVSRRKSPVDSMVYEKMISDFSTIINTIANGNSPALNQNLAELKNAVSPNHPSDEAQRTSFAPKATTIRGPTPSNQSAELKRTSRFVSNPYVQSKQQEFPQRVANAFPPSQDVKPKSLSVNQPSDFVPPGDFAPSGNFTPAGDFASAPDFSPAGNFQPSLAPPTTFVPQQSTFAPAESDRPIDHRSIDLASHQNTSPEPKNQLQSNPYMSLDPQPAALPAEEPQSDSLDWNPQTISQDDIVWQPSQELDSNGSVDSSQISPKNEAKKAEPKIVMDDKFFGQPTAIPLPNQGSSGNYHAKISLPEPEPSDALVPETPDLDNGVNLQVANDQVQRPGNKSNSAASSNISFPSTDPAAIISRSEEAVSSKSAKLEHALRGKCPVTLLTESKWVDGNPKWGCIHRNRVYIFANEQKLKTFQTDPDAYSPILAGYDPVVYQESGRLVDGLEKHGVFMGEMPRQRIVLFGDPETRARFVSEPMKYLDAVRQAMEQTGASPKLLR